MTHFTHASVYYQVMLNPIHVGSFQGWSWMGRDQKDPSSLKPVTHILKRWKLAVLPYLKKTPKIYELRDTPLEFCWHHHFSSEINKFYYIRKNKYRLHFGTRFLILLTFFVSRDFIDKHGYDFDDVSKINYSGLS